MQRAPVQQACVHTCSGLLDEVQPVLDTPHMRGLKDTKDDRQDEDIYAFEALGGTYVETPWPVQAACLTSC